MRCLHVAETYRPDYGGGAELYLHDIARYLADHGHAVSILCAEAADRDAYTIRTENRDGIDVFRVNLPYFKTLDPEGWRLGLVRWLRHERRVSRLVTDVARAVAPDIIHYHTARPFGEGALFALGRMDLPMVAMLHDAWLLCGRVMLLRSPFEQACVGPGLGRCLLCMYSEYDRPRILSAVKLPWRIFRLGVYRAYRLWRRQRARRELDGAFAYSRFIQRMHTPHLSGPVRYTPLGVACGPSSVRRVRLPNVPVRLGFIAGFQRHKGILQVLDALQGLCAEGVQNFRLAVFGPSGPGDQDQIDRRGLAGHVTLMGLYDAAAIPAVYGTMDVAIMATLVMEPFGRVPLEAAAAGVPTIAPAIGGIVESITHDVDGLLYRFRDTADLKRQLRRLLCEPGLLQRLASGVRPPLNTNEALRSMEEFYQLFLGEVARREPEGGGA